MFLGKSFIGFYMDDLSQPLNQFNEAYICSKCGTDWCRTLVQEAEWMPLRKPCPRCADPFMVVMYGDAIPWGRDPTLTLKTANQELLNFILLRLLDAAEQLGAQDV